ncbi:IclR family transcriptional regulator [Halobellus rufus]|jgi:DNA-binding IclR family transcriptional regulator|uniref:IclR family transcriptional regulator n=1 Tax=Halobellus rufus TaxID=1448860 RepID=UPI000678B147|nr:IclR family transcriptional regulator [Halobellus rufus]
MGNDDGIRVNALETTNDIIEALDEFNGARVTELAEYLDRPQSVVHNHLTTLKQLEYIVQEGNEYRLSLRFLKFGERVRHRSTLYNFAKSEVQQLAEESGELITLLVEEHGRGIYLDIGQGSQDIEYPAITGARTYLHCSATGKSILAHLSDEEVDTIIDKHGLPAQSSNTITDRNELDEELETIRERGLAFDMEEFREGMRSVGKPILLQDGTPIGALSIAGPAHRMKADRLEKEMPELLRQSVNVIELNLNDPNIQ